MRYQVKKVGPNQGKWFYTCQKDQVSQCSFFLFEDRAEAREKEAIFSNQETNESTSRDKIIRAETPQSEYASTIAGTGPLFSPTSTAFPTPVPRRRIFHGTPRSQDEVAWSSGVGGGYDSDEFSDATADGARGVGIGHREAATTPTSKRKRLAGEDGDAGPGAGNLRGRVETIEFDNFDDDEVMQLVEMADPSQQLSQSQESQRSQFSDPPSTPSGRGMRAGLVGLRTPTSRNIFQVASEPGPKRFKTAQGAAPLTPTPARTRNAFSLPQGDRYENDPKLTTEVRGLFKGERIPETVWRDVRKALNLHVDKGRGVERARDMLREKVKFQDQTIAELEKENAELRSRAVELENEREKLKNGGEKLNRAASHFQTLFKDGADKTDGANVL